MSTQRLPGLPAGVSPCEAGTNSHCHWRVSPRFLHATSVNTASRRSASSRYIAMAVALILLIETPHNISLFKSP
jgi:hypothetical protein